MAPWRVQAYSDGTSCTGTFGQNTRIVAYNTCAMCVRILHTTARKGNTEVTLVPVHAIKVLDEDFSDQLHAQAALFHGTTCWYQSKTMLGKSHSRCWTKISCLTGITWLITLVERWSEGKVDRGYYDLWFTKDLS